MFSSDAPMEQATESFDFYESTGYLEGVLDQLGSGSTNVVNTNNTLKRAWTSCGSESDFATALASFQEEKKVDVIELEQELSGRTKRENISPDEVRGGDNSFLNENGGGYHFNQQDVEPGNMVGLAVPPDPLRLVIVDPPGPIGLGLGMIPHGPIEFNPSDNNYFSVVSTSVAPLEPVEVNPSNNNNNYFHVVGTSVAPAEPLEVNPSDNNNYFNAVGSSVASVVGGHQNQGNENRAEVNFVLEKRHKRMIKNRESAARSRARKQAYATELELEVEELKRENSRLMREKFYDEMIAKPPVKPSPLLRRTYSAPHAKYRNWNQADVQ